MQESPVTWAHITTNKQMEQRWAIIHLHRWILWPESLSVQVFIISSWQRSSEFENVHLVSVVAGQLEYSTCPTSIKQQWTSLGTDTRGLSPELCRTPYCAGRDLLTAAVSSHPPGTACCNRCSKWCAMTSSRQESQWPNPNSSFSFKASTAYFPHYFQLLSVSMNLETLRIDIQTQALFVNG